MIAQLKRIFRAEIKYMYCMFTLSHPYCFKIGISERPRVRRREIDTQVKAYIGARIHVRMFPPLPMLFARFAEKQIHRIGRKTGFSTNWAAGTTGETEWYKCPNVVTALAFWYYAGDPKLALCALVCPFVWDAYLLILCVFMLDIAIFWGAAWAIFNYFF